MRRVQASSTVEAVDTLVQRLRYRALEQPEQVAYTFLTYGEAGAESLTYKDLDQRAQAISTYLHAQGAAGKPVLLLFPPGLEYIAAYFGCLYAGAIAVPAYVPQSVRGLPRIQAIIADAQAEFVLTTTTVLTKVMRWVTNVPELIYLTWVATDSLDLAQGEEAWWDTSVDSTTLAFLQYTSGSTATPKGVMVSHGNLMHNLEMIHKHWRMDEINAPVSVSWLPIFHDMGLIMGILSPLYSGYPVYLMAPPDFLQRPLRWLQAISDYRATISCAPNFAYELCLRRIAEKDLSGLDLSSLVGTGNAAEPVRASTITRFIKYFSQCGLPPTAFRPGYGLAEATLLVTSGYTGEPSFIQNVNKHRLDQNYVEVVAEQDANSRQLVGCGRPSSGQRIVIVNPETCEPCAEHQIGEIWLSGPSVTGGYWNRPEETARIFQAHLTNGEGPFLRTGDLGVYQDDNLFITGRLKDLIILDGRNLYPQDIELTIEQAHPAIRPDCCVAFSIEDKDKESLIALAEIDHRYHVPESTATGQGVVQVNMQEIIKNVREAIFAQHEINVQKVVLLKIGGILKTSSGKPQRRACRQAFLQGELKAWNE